MEDNLNPPDFGPGLPVYPHLEQLIKISVPADANGVYTGAVQQYKNNLTFRDREPCYLVEPNHIILVAGYYDARLVGSYLGLPLFATTCCPTGSSSSVGI